MSSMKRDLQTLETEKGKGKGNGLLYIKDTSFSLSFPLRQNAINQNCPRIQQKQYTKK